MKIIIIFVTAKCSLPDPWLDTKCDGPDCGSRAGIHCIHRANHKIWSDFIYSCATMILDSRQICGTRLSYTTHKARTVMHTRHTGIQSVSSATWIYLSLSLSLLLPCHCRGLEYTHVLLQNGCLQRCSGHSQTNRTHSDRRSCYALYSNYNFRPATVEILSSHRRQWQCRCWTNINTATARKRSRKKQRNNQRWPTKSAKTPNHLNIESNKNENCICVLCMLFCVLIHVFIVAFTHLLLSLSFLFGFHFHN